MSQHRKGAKKAHKRESEEKDVDRKEKQLSQMIFGGLDSHGRDQSESGLVTDSVDPEKRRRDDPNTLLSNRSKRPLLESVDDGESAIDSDAVWKDEDDSSIMVSSTNSGTRLMKLRDTREVSSWRADEVERRLRQRYEKTAGKVSRIKWADVGESAGESKSNPYRDPEDDVGAESSQLFSRRVDNIPPNAIEMVRLKDPNAVDLSGAALRTVSFHPESDPDSPLLMTAGLDKSVRFYSIGQDDESRKIHGIHCK